MRNKSGVHARCVATPATVRIGANERAQLNMANPATGQQKVIDLDDEKRLQHLYDKRLAQEVPGEVISDDYKGYIFKIAGGQDKEGFSMKQGVLTPSRVRLLMYPGTQGCRGYGMRSGERKRKSVRGCIVSHAISVLHLVVLKAGDKEIEGLTNSPKPRRLGPKRAGKIRRLFNLSNKDDVRKYVIRREIAPKVEGGKVKTKAPKIQRLVTPVTLQRKRRARAAKIAAKIKAVEDAKAYEKMLATRASEARLRHASERARSEKARAEKAAAGAPKKTIAKSTTSKTTKGKAAAKPAAKPAAKTGGKSAKSGKGSKPKK